MLSNAEREMFYKLGAYHLVGLYEDDCLSISDLYLQEAMESAFKFEPSLDSLRIVKIVKEASSCGLKEVKEVLDKVRLSEARPLKKLNKMVILRVSKNGSVFIPRAVRSILGWQNRQFVIANSLDGQNLVLTPIEDPAADSIKRGVNQAEHLLLVDIEK